MRLSVLDPLVHRDAARTDAQIGVVPQVTNRVNARFGNAESKVLGFGCRVIGDIFEALRMEQLVLGAYLAQAGVLHHKKRFLVFGNSGFGCHKRLLSSCQNGLFSGRGIKTPGPGH